MLLLAALAAAPAGSGELPRVAVFDFQAMGLDDLELRFLMEQVLTEVDATARFKSIGKSDLETMLGMERIPAHKSLLGRPPGYARGSAGPGRVTTDTYSRKI